MVFVLNNYLKNYLNINKFITHFFMKFKNIYFKFLYNFCLQIHGTVNSFYCSFFIAVVKSL